MKMHDREKKSLASDAVRKLHKKITLNDERNFTES